MTGLMPQFVLDTWSSLPPMVQYVAASSFKILIVLIGVILVVAYSTYFERKVIGSMQARVGPNRVGPFGLLQPFADVFKLLFKEVIIPSESNRFLFVIAPMLSLIPALATWAVIPMNDTFVIADINAGLLYVLALTSVGVYGVILAGWATNSKYAFLGAMRSAAQIVAYEIAMGFALVGVLMAGGSLNLGDIVAAQAGGVELVPRAFVPAVFGVLDIGRGGDQPCTVRRGRGRIGNRGRLPRRVLGRRVRAVLPRRVRQHGADRSTDVDLLLRRLGVALRGLDVPRRFLPQERQLLLAVRQDLPVHVHVLLVARDFPALSLRPDHAARVESVHSRNDRLDRG